MVYDHYAVTSLFGGIYSGNAFPYVVIRINPFSQKRKTNSECTLNQGDGNPYNNWKICILGMGGTFQGFWYLTGGHWVSFIKPFGGSGNHAFDQGCHTLGLR